MLSTTPAIPNAPRANRLSNQERRLVHQIVDGAPRLYRRLKHDPRVSHAVAELLDRYRQELIEAVQSGLEASLALVPETCSTPPPVAAPGGSADAFARDGLPTSNASLSLADEDDADSRREMTPVWAPHDLEIDPDLPLGDKSRKACPDGPAAGHAPEIMRRAALTASAPARPIRTRRSLMTPLKYKFLVTYSSIATVLVLSFVGSFLFGLYW